MLIHHNHRIIKNQNLSIDVLIIKIKFIDQVLNNQVVIIETINYNHSRVSDDDFYWKTNRIDKRIARLHNEKKTFSTKYVDALSHDKKYMTVTRRDFYNIK